MEPITRLYYCTNCSRGCFLCILKGKRGQLPTIFASWRCDICKETAFNFSQFCKHSVSVSTFCFGFFCCRFFSTSTVVQTTDLLFNCFLFGCLSRQLGKEVVSHWHNICNSVLSTAIAVNKYLKSITKCRVSSLDVHHKAVNCSCLPPCLVWKTFCLLFRLQQLSQTQAALKMLKSEPRIWFHILKMDEPNPIISRHEVHRLQLEHFLLPRKWQKSI